MGQIGLWMEVDIQINDLMTPSKNLKFVLLSKLFYSSQSEKYFQTSLLITLKKNLEKKSFLDKHSIDSNFYFY
jgi:hypothetical protein